MHAAFAHLLHAEGPQGDPGGSGHESQERRGKGHEEIHRSGDRQRHPLGALQGNRLGNHLAEDDNHIGDQHEGNNDGDTVRVEPGVRQGQEQRFQNAGHGGLADPAQSQAGHRDAELHGVEDVVELLMELLDGARADAVRRYHLLQSRFAHVHQCEFSGHEERVCRDQQDHHHDAQHNESNHEAEILPSAGERERLAIAAGKAGAAFRNVQSSLRRGAIAAISSTPSWRPFLLLSWERTVYRFWRRALPPNSLVRRMGCISHGSGTALSVGRFSGCPEVFPLAACFNLRMSSALLFGHHAEVILDGRQVGSVGDLHKLSWWHAQLRYRDCVQDVTASREGARQPSPQPNLGADGVSFTSNR